MLKSKLLPITLTLITAILFITSCTSDTETVYGELHFSQFDPLHEVYKDFFLIGTTSWNSRMTGNRLAVIRHHFNSFTPENEMKPDHIQNVRNVWTWSQLDQQLGRVQGMTLIGHTLAWHSQTPEWHWDAPRHDRAAALANMQTHIQTVMNRYGARLHTMDVVNEAFTDGGGVSQGNTHPVNDWRSRLRQTEGWYLALADSWIEEAFLRTAEIVDANGWNVKLYYNDFNLDLQGKRLATYQMVKEINEKHAGRRPGGKQLIEGIGMQAHYWVGGQWQSTIPANVRASIELFSTLPGVSISITELDLEWRDAYGQQSLTSSQERAQALFYGQLFEIFREYATGPANPDESKRKIERVSIWGTNDPDSWRHQGFPLLFDGNLNAKEAFLVIHSKGEYAFN